MKPLSQATTGDIIMNTQGSTCMVLTVSNTLIARSCFYPRYDTLSEWITVYSLKEAGWKVLQEGKEVLTRKEAEDILNIKIED